MILVGMFAATLLWIIFADVLIEGLLPFGRENLNESTNATDTLDKIEIAWHWWPVVFIVGLFLWGIASAQKREYGTYYG